MQFVAQTLAGVFAIHLDKREDTRGFFARFFCAEEFRRQGLETQFPQINTSLTHESGTLRGMHYQLAPHAEVKIVRCLRGALWDVVLDLRPESPTFGRSMGLELTADNRVMMYCPRGFAHGFLTLTEDVEALYLVSTPYAPACERGIRWDDGGFNISWPRQPVHLSDKDRAWPDFDAPWHLGPATPT